MAIHEGRVSTKTPEITESPVGLIRTINAEWPNDPNGNNVKPRNIEASGGDISNQPPKEISQRLGLGWTDKDSFAWSLSRLRFSSEPNESVEVKSLKSNSNNQPDDFRPVKIRARKPLRSREEWNLSDAWWGEHKKYTIFMIIYIFLVQAVAIILLFLSRMLIYFESYAKYLPSTPKRPTLRRQHAVRRCKTLDA